MMGKGDYVKLFRSTRDSVLTQFPKDTELLWYRLLQEVNWQPTRGYFDGEKIWIRPGQMPSSYKHISNLAECSQSSARSHISRLKEFNMIEWQTSSTGSLLTIKNWFKYQSTVDSYGDIKKSNTNEMQARDKQTTQQSNKQSDNTLRTKELEETKNNLSFQDKQVEIIGELKEANMDEEIDGELWGLAGRWINTYSYKQTIETLREIGCKNEWSTIRNKQKPVATIVNWIKNRDKNEPTNPDAEALSRAMGNS